jgi:enoyl-[acyl-carrier-protein] reductase (NADH)
MEREGRLEGRVALVTGVAKTNSIGFATRIIGKISWVFGSWKNKLAQSAADLDEATGKHPTTPDARRPARGTRGAQQGS